MNAAIDTEQFPFLAGCLCLDFANTVDMRSSANPVESLNSYRDLIEWGVESGALSESQANGLLDASDQRPVGASIALSKARDLRETVFRVFYSLTQNQEPDRSDLAELHSAFMDATANSQFVVGPDGYTLDWVDESISLDRVAWAVAQSATKLLTSERLDRVRTCGEDTCRWMFLDTSRNGRRRWCDMKVCGNRAKARAHYRRRRSSRE